MTVSSTLFQRGLYLEHLDEAGFLFELCRQLRDDVHTEWTALAAFEQRLDAHLDALHVGADLALDVCIDFLLEGEPGEVFASLCLACRMQAAPALSSVLNGERLQVPDVQFAVSSALSQELPSSWESGCVRALGNSTAAQLRVIASTIGARRLSTDGALHRALPVAPQAALVALLQACGRLNEAGTTRALRSFYDHDDAAVREAALWAGLITHDEVASQVVQGANGSTLSPLILSIACGRSAARQLLLDRSSWSAPAVAVQALGVIGDLAAVRPLLGLLDDPALAQSAAQALHVITGAPLVEGVHLPEVVREDELFDRELQRFRATGEAPLRVDGKPYGSTVQRLSQDIGRWTAWLEHNATQFDGSKRYRFGRLCTPAATLRGITLSTTPKSYRLVFCDELLVRYGIDVAVDVDAPVATQRAALKRAVDPVMMRTSSFEPGDWYLAGKPI